MPRKALSLPQVDVLPDGRYRPQKCASKDKRRAAAELFAAGIGYTRASRILDIPVNTLREWSKAWRAGKFGADISRHLYRYPEETKEKAIRMRLTGASWREIQEETGATATSVRKWVNARTARRGPKPGLGAKISEGL